MELPIPGSDDTVEPTRGRRLARRTWDRIGFGVLSIATLVTYLWNITVNGMGNDFYAAAAQAGSKDWEALLFGSLDAQNFITVDKPPVSQWVMGLSGQIFGFGSASILVPEALMGVATVTLLYGTVRRISGPNAALLAGGALALTPVAAMMFRYDNPDAVMVLLMMAAGYCTVRALERADWRWITLAGVALGFAFLAKMLEGIMVLPAIGFVYLIAAPTTVRKRLLHLLGSAVAFLLSAGWYVLLTLLWPASSRPYIAGSTDDNFMNLVLGYNGFARVLGRNHNVFRPDAAVGGDAQGLTRLFTGEFGFEIGWLLPAALLAFVLVVIARGRAPRTDLARAGAVLFGGWMLVDGLVLSFMKTMAHPYYCLSFVPAVCGMLAIGVHEMWGRRDTWFGRGGLAALILGTGSWSWWILGRNAEWLPALRWVALAVTVAASACLLLNQGRRVAGAALVAGLVGAVLGPAAYSVATLGQSHGGGMAMVGPARPGAHRLGGFGHDADDPQLDAMLRDTHTDWSAAIERSSAAADLELATNTAVMAIGGFGGIDPAPTLGEFEQDVANHRISYYVAPVHGPRVGGFGDRRAHADITAWVAANFAPISVGKHTVYDLTAPTS
ncbi:glycosyl transferase [Mycobacterium antarcticum]|nr:glycosyl transferase [Mycolicibacterium sp. TUM20984]